MTLEIWLAYVVASTILLLIPGPTILLVVSYALAEGRRAAWGTVTGAALGDVVAVTLSCLGLGALLAASAELFTLLKWLGAAYLVYLGVKMIRSRPQLDLDAGATKQRAQRAMFLHAFAVTTLNPKSIVFFVAFLPQFVVPSAPAAPQLFLLGATFVGLALIVLALYAILAGSLRQTITRPAVLTAVSRAGGAALITAGAMVAATQRSS